MKDWPVKEETWESVQHGNWESRVFPEERRRQRTKMKSQSGAGPSQMGVMGDPD